MVHFGKGYKQKVHRIQHEFDAHENNDGIAAGEHPNDTDAEQGKAEIDIVLYWHID
jgi:hypothetical protein